MLLLYAGYSNKIKTVRFFLSGILDLSKLSHSSLRYLNRCCALILALNKQEQRADHFL